MLQELKRQGNNLNQIARTLHETNYIDTTAADVLNNCWQTYRAIREIEEGVRNAVIQGKIEQGEAEKSD
jgi:glutamine synthetase adenylyltransferase